MATATKPKPDPQEACPTPRSKRARRKQPAPVVYTVIVRREPDGKHYSACAPALDDCGSFGHTLPECLQMTEEALRLSIACRRELGWPVPPDDPHVMVDMTDLQEAFVYRLTIRENPPPCAYAPCG